MFTLRIYCIVLDVDGDVSEQPGVTLHEHEQRPGRRTGVQQSQHTWQ